MHYDGYIRDSGLPDMVQHADQRGGVLWDSIVRPTSEEVVVKNVSGVRVILHYMQQSTRTHTDTPSQTDIRLYNYV